jgi:hypothetical protein
MKGISSAAVVSVLLLSQPALAIGQGNWGSQNLGAVGSNSTGNISANPSGSGAYLSAGYVSGGGRHVGSSIPHTSIGSRSGGGRDFLNSPPVAFYPDSRYYAGSLPPRDTFNADTRIGVEMDSDDVWF